LCGYRPNGLPNTSDKNDAGSVEWGRALFAELHVDPSAHELDTIGSRMEQAATAELSRLRPDLAFGSGTALGFEQYTHLRVFRDFSKAYKGPEPSLEADVIALRLKYKDADLKSFFSRVLRAQKQSKNDHDLVTALRAAMPEESLLNLDMTVAAPVTQNLQAPPIAPRLLIGLSSKWSLRTDRAQDCISQGSKLVSLRRGRMPHYAVLTMEPRPAMLKLLAYGSGSVDCVYHLALPELRRAAASIETTKKGQSWRPREDLERMVAQGRLRDWDQLVQEVGSL
jgi:hypothetical protein